MIDEFENLEELYDKFGNTKLKYPFFTLNWHKNYLKIFNPEKKYFLLSNVNNEKVIGIFILIDGELHFSGGEEISDYMDITSESDNLGDHWNNFIEFFRNRKITKLNFNNLSYSSSSYKYFESNSNKFKSIEINKEDTTPIINLSASWDNYVASLDRKPRHELRRKLRKFEAENNDVNFYLNNNLQNGMESLIELMSLDTAKKEFLTPFMKEFFTSLSESFTESMKFMELRTSTKVLASICAFVTGNELLLYNSGFDEDKYSGSGFYLKALSIKWAIENGITRYNFLQGGERYKYDLGGIDSFVAKVKINL